MTHVPRCDPPFDSALVRTLAAVLTPFAAVPSTALRRVDLEALASLARHWHVAPSLWLKLRHGSDLPANILDQLRTEYWRNVRANAALRAEAGALFVALNARGVVPMLMKGGCQLFDPPSGNAGTRFMEDLDLLVPPGQDRLSFDTLCDLGFTPVPDWDTDRFHHWPRLSRPAAAPAGVLAVEIHKTPWFNGGVAEASRFFAASVAIEGTAGHARLPCLTHRVLHNAVHAFPNDYYETFYYYRIAEPHTFETVLGAVDLKQLLDFAELCAFRGGELDWGGVQVEADGFDRRCELQQWSFLARELFAMPLPDGVAKWHVDRPVPARLRSRRVVKAALRRTGLLGPVQRLKAWWLT